jgi:hypothetical protein
VNIRFYIVLSNKTDVIMPLPTNLKTGNKRIVIRDLGKKNALPSTRIIKIKE